MSSCYVIVFSNSIDEHLAFGEAVKASANDVGGPTLFGCTTTGYVTTNIPAALNALGGALGQLAMSPILAGRADLTASQVGEQEIDKHPKSAISVDLAEGWQGFVLLFTSMDGAKDWMSRATKGATANPTWFVIPTV